MQRHSQTDADDEPTGRYTLGRPLGDGGMGCVYVGYDETLEREVAIKMLRPELKADPDAVERLRREALACSRLGHPNLVSAFELAEVEGALAIVMELVDGPTVRDLVNTGTRSSDEAAELILQVADGLAAVHEIGVVHRDLKPENLLVDRRTGRVKIADFGLAVTDGARRLTQAGMILGTPEYMSPERFRSYDPAPQDDIYALGVVFYELITGRPPIEGDCVLTVVANVLQRGDTPLGCPEAGVYEPFITACLAHDPADRPGDGSEALALLSALHGARAGDERTEGEAVVVVGGMELAELRDRLPEAAEIGQRLERDLVVHFGASEPAFRWLRELVATDPQVRGAMETGTVVGSGIGIFAGAAVGRAARLARLARPGDVLVGPGARASVGLGYRASLEVVGHVHFAGKKADTVVHRIRHDEAPISDPKKVRADGYVTCECGQRSPAQARAALTRMVCPHCGRTLTAEMSAEAACANHGSTDDLIRLDQFEDAILADLIDA